jgi:hypothetical protein
MTDYLLLAVPSQKLDERVCPVRTERAREIEREGKRERERKRVEEHSHMEKVSFASSLHSLGCDCDKGEIYRDGL